MTDVDDVKSLVDAGLGAERESCINLGRNLSRHLFQDLLSELHEQSIEGGIDLVIDAFAVLLAV